MQRASNASAEGNAGRSPQWLGEGVRRGQLPVRVAGKQGEPPELARVRRADHSRLAVEPTSEGTNP